MNEVIQKKSNAEVSANILGSRFEWGESGARLAGGRGARLRLVRPAHDVQGRERVPEAGPGASAHLRGSGGIFSTAS